MRALRCFNYFNTYTVKTVHKPLNAKVTSNKD